MSSDKSADSRFRRWTQKYNRFRHSKKDDDSGNEPTEGTHLPLRLIKEVTQPTKIDDFERPEAGAAEGSASQRGSRVTLTADLEENNVAISEDVLGEQPSPSNELSLWDKSFERIKTSNADPKIVATIEQFANQLAHDQLDPAQSIAKDIKRLMEQTILDSETDREIRTWKIKIGGIEYSVRHVVEKTVGLLNRFASIGDVISSYDPGHAALPWAAVRFVLTVLTAQSKLNGDIAFGLAQITSLVFQSDIYQSFYLASASFSEELLQRVSSELEEIIVQVYTQSLLFLGFVIRQYESIGITAILKLDDMERYNQELFGLGDKLDQAADNCEKYHSHQNQENVDQVLKLARESHQTIHDHGTILLDIRKYTLLSSLNHAKGAAYDFHANENDPRCHPDTRVELLNGIQTWASNDNGETIFWLQGMAGTGKSTIARTVAERLDRRGQLGASFFFKRGEGDRGRAAYFFSTISQQLCQRVESFAQLVQQAIEADPNITEKSISQQFQKLALEPLGKLPRNNAESSKILVVIDALDECDQEEDAKRIISLLSQAKNPAPFKLRFFVTSRPEYHIRLGFGQIEENSHRDVALHKISHPVVEQDIATYLVYKLALIRDDYNRLTENDLQLNQEWPSSKEVQKLVKMATPLFIVAATLCRLLEDVAPSNPALELTKLLSLPAVTSDGKLTATYLPVIQRLLMGKTGSQKTARQRADIVGQFQAIIAPLVLLAEPLSVTVLAIVLGTDRQIVDGIVNSLHSVLRVPSEPGAPVRIFHLSFREFLTNKEGGIPDGLWVDKEETNKRLAAKCLKLLSKDGNLRYNVCDLQTLGEPKSNISGEKLQGALPPAVQYACLYWVYHLKEANVKLDDQSLVFSFLQEHFLHWLEALSLMKRISESIRLTQILQSLINPDTGIKTLEFLHDAQRFILRYHKIASYAPLQLYSSALLFAPYRSVIRQTFKKHISWIIQQPLVKSNWSACLQILEDHRDAVLSVTFSNDNKLLASASTDRTVKIWDALTGGLQCTLFGHIDEVTSAIFSSDDQTIISGSDDKTIKAWDVSTGEIYWTFEGHTDSVNSVIFLGTTGLFASASQDTTVKIWDLATRELKLTLQGHDNSVGSIAYSSLSGLIASGSTDKKVHLWDTTTGRLVRILKGHSLTISALFFSSDSTLVLSSDDETVNIWDAQTGVLNNTIRCFSTPLAFSVDRNMRAAASPTQSDVVINNIETGKPYQVLRGHTDWVLSAAFSSKSRLIASGSLDSTIRIWDITKESPMQVLETSEYEILFVKFSPDSKQLASASSDGSIRLWDARTGRVQYTFQDDISLVGTVIFSPDSNLIASVSIYGAVRIWGAEDGRPRSAFKAGRLYDSLKAASFSSDSKTIEVTLSDCSEVYDIGTGRLKCRTFDHYPTSIVTGNEISAHDTFDSSRESIVENEGGMESHIQNPPKTSSSPTKESLRTYQWAESARSQTYNLDCSATWIQRGGQNLLWIPHKYRRGRGTPTPMPGSLRGMSSWDISGTHSLSQIAVGGISGQVIIIGFEIPQ